jgi:bacterial/archaeal transporter family-2 protein
MPPTSPAGRRPAAAWRLWRRSAAGWRRPAAAWRAWRRSPAGWRPWRRPAPAAGPAKALPPWAALALAGVGGVASATQSAANGELGHRLGSPPLAGLINNAIGWVLLLGGWWFLASIRTGLRALRGSRLPWWGYLGGLGGMFFVVSAAYAVPVIGVAVFTIAQVTGNSAGGLAVDRVGLSPAGRLALTGSRLAGALLGVAAVALSQLGRPVGDLAVGFLLLGIGAGAGVAVQSALNGRVSIAGSPAAATLINYIAATPALVVVAAVAGSFTRDWPSAWPTEWYLYAGGLFGVAIVTILVVSVRVIGVLRTGLLVVAGQLLGAILLDALIPGGARPTPALAAGAVLTLVAAWVAGRSARGVPEGT